MRELAAPAQRAFGALAILALLVACGERPVAQSAATAPAARAAARPPLREAFAAGPHRGICFAHSLGPGVGYGTPAAAASLAELRALGATWVSITPFGFLAGPEAVEIRRLSGESDARLRAVTEQAHGLGLKVMLKPHLWLRPPHWVGEVAQRDEAGWSAFFAAYEELARHYARLARDSGADALLVGNELAATSGREADWRRVVAVARQEYEGPLGYGANYSEAESVAFWDALDFIGISAYFPLVEKPSPSRLELVVAWGPIVDRLGALSQRWQRKVLFTEVGYPAADWAAWRPWEPAAGGAPNPRLQAAAYGAFLEAVWPQPWVGGAYWWKWFSDGGKAPEEDAFDFRGQPAAEVVRGAWGPAPAR